MSVSAVWQHLEASNAARTLGGRLGVTMLGVVSGRYVGGAGVADVRRSGFDEREDDMGGSGGARPPSLRALPNHTSALVHGRSHGAVARAQVLRCPTLRSMLLRARPNGKFLTMQHMPRHHVRCASHCAGSCVACNNHTRPLVLARHARGHILAIKAGAAPLQRPSASQRCPGQPGARRRVALAASPGAAPPGLRTRAAGDHAACRAETVPWPHAGLGFRRDLGGRQACSDQ